MNHTEQTRPDIVWDFSSLLVLDNAMADDLEVGQDLDEVHGMNHRLASRED